jgi:hypothetical protein
MVAAVAVAVLALAAAAPAFAASAINPSNRPTPVPNRSNGELPNSDLISVAPDCRAYRAAATSLSLLLKAARAQGETVVPEECYRPLQGQVDASQKWTAAGNSACAATPQTSSSGKPVGTSMHGWGKAADFSFGGGSFGSPGYQYLKSQAGRYGWNHPGWAEPGGSACPEAWHWEWVGDGGTQGGDPIRADVVGLVPSADDQGYATITGLGAVNPRGDAVDHGSAAGTPLNWVVVGSAATPSRNGYWMVAADGGVFTFGDAGFFGSTGNMHLNQPVVGMAPTPTGLGYWLVAADGGVFTFGDAKFFGSTGSMRLNKPVMAMAPTPTGKGYWLIASDGGIFTFGDATFQGSTGGTPPAAAVVDLTVDRAGRGYWITAANGQVFPFGDARSFGAG